FARIAGGRATITVAPRLVVSLGRGRAGAPVGPTIWRETTIVLPPALAGRRWTNVYTGETLAPGASLRIADALATFPVGLWWSADSRLFPSPSSGGAPRGSTRRKRPGDAGMSLAPGGVDAG